MQATVYILCREPPAHSRLPRVGTPIGSGGFTALIATASPRSGTAFGELDRDLVPKDDELLVIGGLFALAGLHPAHSEARDTP